MRLLHYTTDPLTAIRSVEQVYDAPRYDKPNGLWLSVEGPDDWREWCKSEEFGDPDAQRCYEIVIAPDANLCRLSGPNLLRAFTAEYGMDPYMGPMAGHTQFARLAIDWPRVAEKYAGIIIAPYIWECRMSDDTRWYYGWDCASGCIWDASAVERIVEVVADDT